MKRRELKIEPIYRNCSMFFQKLPKWGMIQEKNVIAREKREEESTSNISLFPKKKKEDKASFVPGPQQKERPHRQETSTVRSRLLLSWR